MTALKITLIIICLCSTLLFSTEVHARRVPDPNSPEIREFKGKLYQMKRKEWRNITSISDLDQRELKPVDWHTIISTGDPENAIALIYALGMFLTNEEVWPFIEAGLLRKPNKESKLAKTKNIANAAYSTWRYLNQYQHLSTVKTHPIYRQNLAPEVKWHKLFTKSTHDISSMEEALAILRSQSLINSQINTLSLETSHAMNFIAHQTETEQLMPLIKNDNFQVALASWVALSSAEIDTLNLKKVAETAVNHALWIQNKIKYKNGSSCVDTSTNLLPLVAALDLFADYLSVDQLKLALNETPEIWSGPKLHGLNINHPKIKAAILASPHHHKHELIEKHMAKWAFYNLANHSDDWAAEMTQHEYYSDYTVAFGTNKNLVDYFINELNNPSSEESFESFTFDVMHRPNEHGHRFLTSLIKSEYLENNSAYFAKQLFKESIWPRNWQGLKQRFITKLQADIDQNENTPTLVKLASKSGDQ